MNDFLQLATNVSPLRDYLLGWLLYLPRDLAVFFLAIGTTASMTIARKRWTNQDLLRRGRQDLVRLKALKRDAKRNGDKGAIQRMRTTEAMIKMTQLRADLIVLAVVIVPIGLVAMWAAERLDYFPARSGDSLQVSAAFTPSSMGKLTHVVPVEGIKLGSPAVQQIALERERGAEEAYAKWTIIPEAAQGKFSLQIRHQNETVAHEMEVGTRYYLPPHQIHPGKRVLATEVQLERYLWLGFVPGIDAFGIAPWMVGYLILSLGLVPVMRRVFATA